ncbi:hypothetical protein C5N14_16505 [Micromonospora sp. MW-13]|uniref:hypothetical protein n=1 Tax=Micromonospora sp. MW-13 TaxID=2094022 RepID=UPI000E431CD1|nr:hypothetical protein [Micromonospora sp. MW-13]RGC67809.1 hypothetical protein C5N14_16505 [Micromonospora sp. MW-13]
MRRGAVVAVSAGFSAVLGVGYLLLPTMGSDLSAQVARADFFAAHGPALVDLRWYGGIQPLGYSLVSPPVMAVLGVRVTGVLALVVAAAAFAALLVRTGVPRPLLGGLVGAVTIAGNLVSGRVTYGLGVAFGLAALLALTLPPGAAAGRRRLRVGLVAAAALLASATSPVAGLFVGLAGAALLLTRRFGDGLLLGVAAAAPLAVTGLLFGEGGWMNISRTDTLRAALTSLVVAALVAYRPVRVGALLSAAGVLVAALVHTPVGLNATRLVVMFALPVLAAAARLPERATCRLPAALRRGGTAGTALAALLAAVCWWQPPVVPADLRGVGGPTTEPAYFAPLRAELARRGLTGRVEVPPTRDYWEAAHLGDVPLARGWLRQADIARNPLFFTTVPGAAGTGVPLTADSYRAWLADNAVQYVAVPDADLSWVGRAEAELVDGGLPYLTEVWSERHWRLYAVSDPTPLVAAPGELVGQDAASLTLRMSGPGTVRVRVRHSRWLRVDGQAALAPDGAWTVVTVPSAGNYRVTG